MCFSFVLENLGQTILNFIFKPFCFCQLKLHSRKWVKVWFLRLMCQGGSPFSFPHCRFNTKHLLPMLQGQRIVPLMNFTPKKALRGSILIWWLIQSVICLHRTRHLLGMKKKFFDKVMQLERLIEEEAIILEEMKQHWTHLTRTCRALKDQANVLSDDLATQSEY